MATIEDRNVIDKIGIISSFDMSKFHYIRDVNNCIDDINDYLATICTISNIVKGSGEYTFENFYGIESAQGNLDKNSIQVGDKSMENILDALKNEIEILRIDYLYAIEVTTKTLQKYRSALYNRRQYLIEEERKNKD